MDDIKIYANNQDDLNQLAENIEKYSKYICVDFGIDKCKISSVKAGETFEHQYQLENGEQIEALNENEAYKYLGYKQAKLIQHKEIKNSLTQEFKHRLNSITRTYLGSKI